MNAIEQFRLIAHSILEYELPGSDLHHATSIALMDSKTAEHADDFLLHLSLHQKRSHQDAFTLLIHILQACVEREMDT